LFSYLTETNKLCGEFRGCATDGWLSCGKRQRCLHMKKLRILRRNILLAHFIPIVERVVGDDAIVGDTQILAGALHTHIIGCLPWGSHNHIGQHELNLSSNVRALLWVLCAVNIIQYLSLSTSNQQQGDFVNLFFWYLVGYSLFDDWFWVGATCSLSPPDTAAKDFCSLPRRSFNSVWLEDKRVRGVMHRV